MKSGYTPIPPGEPDAGAASWRDKSTGGYSMAQLERLVKDCGDQPSTWRARSDLCHAYYDGKQLTDEVMRHYGISQAEAEQATPLQDC